MFPHELTHQIVTNVNPHHDSTAVSSIIGEGFAVWMNQKYWGKKYTLAENLGYSEDELQFFDKNITSLKQFFVSTVYSTDEAIINVFRNRSEKLNEKLPGAIGYYFGYLVVDAYVQKFGPESWKDVFSKSPKEIYQLSGFGSLNMRKLIIYFIIGLVLLIAGIIVTQIAGHKHMAKGMILIFAGFIISAAFGITLLQVRKQFLRKNEPKDILDQD